jgi:hypothetical protein
MHDLGNPGEKDGAPGRGAGGGALLTRTGTQQSGHAGPSAAQRQRQGKMSGLFARPAEIKLVTLTRLMARWRAVQGLGSGRIWR